MLGCAGITNFLLHPVAVIAKVQASLATTSTSTGIVMRSEVATASRMHLAMANPATIQPCIITGIAKTSTIIIITAETVNTEPGLRIAVTSAIQSSPGIAILITGVAITIWGHGSIKSIARNKTRQISRTMMRVRDADLTRHS